MHELPDDLKYTDEHEWVRVVGDVVRVGITEYAQDQLGDVVYVELPKVGDALTAGQPFGVVESVKAASDLFCPVDGEVRAVNEALEEEPELVNDAPYDDGWMIELAPSSAEDIDGLMDADEYTKFVESEG